MIGDTVIPWVKCEACDDFICNYCSIPELARIHVADCQCPPIEWWSAHDMFPYVDCEIQKITDLIAMKAAVNEVGLAFEEQGL